MNVLTLVSFTLIILLKLTFLIAVSAEKESGSVKETGLENVENPKSLKDYSKESNGKENRERKQFAYDGWRAVETYPEAVSGWAPHESQEQIPKRRRIKKRKRRPPVVSLTSEAASGSQENSDVIFWQLTPDLVSDQQSRPYVRRRVMPAYASEEIVSSKEGIRFGSLEQTIQFPDEDNSEENTNAETKENVELKETVPTTTEKSNKIPDLRAILKTRGGLSLSEILQQKNLSLSELLSGNKKAISALTERPSASTIKSTTVTDPETTKYKRLPPSVGLRKNINRNYEQDNESIESLSTKETLEAQRKRLAVLQQHKDSKIYFDVTKFEVVTEPTTEKRIFVPSHPNLYTSVNYKPSDFIFPDQTTEIFSKPSELTTENIVLITQPSRPTTTSQPQENVYSNNNNKLYNRMFLKPKLKINFPTSVIPKHQKLNNKIIFRDEENLPEYTRYPKLTTIPPNAIKISVKDILGYLDNQNEGKLSTDGPLRISIDLGNLVDKTTTTRPPPKLFNFKHVTTPKPTISTTTPSTTTSEVPETTTTSTTTTARNVPEKIRPFTAKDEIMEILKDPIGNEKLSRILNLRNMTIQELVELRERGSSQLHLADIFHNKTKEPEPKDEPFVGRVSSEYFDNFPVFTSRRQQKSLFGESSTQKLLTTTKEPVKTPEIVTVTSFPTFKFEVNKDVNEKQRQQQQIPLEELYPDFFDDQNNNKKISLSEEDVQRLDEVESQLASDASNEKFNVEESVLQDEVFINLPSGVKSAILASLIIVGLSLVVFLAILFIFRWTQRHRQKLNYCNSLSSKFKSPILEVGHRNIKTFVAETLGRKKNNYYKSHLQSMSDDIWQNDRKPSY